MSVSKTLAESRNCYEVDSKTVLCYQTLKKIVNNRPSVAINKKEEQFRYSILIILKSLPFIQ